MTDFLQAWADGLLKARPLALKLPITVVGERDQHLGPRWEFAKVTVMAEPAEKFEVVNEVQAHRELESLRFPEWAIFGVLDILMVSESAPVASVRLTLKEAIWNSTDTSAFAFRQAGRDAGRKILAAMK
jgi:hypothetical protein